MLTLSRKKVEESICVMVFPCFLLFETKDVIAIWWEAAFEEDATSLVGQLLTFVCCPKCCCLRPTENHPSLSSALWLLWKIKDVRRRFTHRSVFQQQQLEETLRVQRTPTNTPTAKCF